MSRLLVLLAIREQEKRESIPLLARLTYSQAEIGSLLGMARNAVKPTPLRARCGRAGERSEGGMAANGK